MEFVNSKVFKNAIRKHSVITKKELRFKPNTRHKVCVVCRTSPNYPWRIYASNTDIDNPTLFIKSLWLEHTCSSLVGKVYHMHAPFIAEEYQEFFMSDPNWTREGMQNAINKDFDMSVGYQICYRARMRAKKLAQGSYKDQYNLLESYAHELKKRNPGTSVWIQTELDGEITVHKGQLLSAVGIDGNNGIHPIAWAIVEAKSRESWIWFLEFLKADLDIHHSGHYTFMSDKQKGLEQAIKELFPDAAHRHCLELKQKLWAVARSCTMNTFMEAMEDLKKSSLSGWQWCLDRPAKHWSKSHFDHKFKCDFLLNNHSENFNKSVLPARKKPILACLEEIRLATMVRLANRRNSSPNWKCKVGPRVEK
ncbi:uncharacterized protein LOC112199525 [Rosa chinensis]|uniref:uncharacterized protein LOC112199525 n=1 Tax=Rosa chinensis TaxID=74649 RepID=UPI000D08AEA7|nr:uncharacterized protein LOC112199525 [Rosa chinensis]